MSPLPSWAWWVVGVAGALGLFVLALPWLVRPGLRLLRLSARAQFQ